MNLYQLASGQSLSVTRHVETGFKDEERACYLGIRVNEGRGCRFRFYILEFRVAGLGLRV
jgi:hypothetical protein